MKQTLKRSWIFFLCSIMTMTFCFSACNLFPASISPLLYEKIEGKEAYRVIDIQPNTIPKEDINIVIPAKHKGLPVTEIGDSAFKGIWYVKSISIPNSVTRIGENAFNACLSLKTINIPDSVTYIGNYAFQNCPLSYNEKDHLNYLGNKNNPYLYVVGASDPQITQVNIDENCKFIASAAFRHFSSITKVTIPDSVISIGDLAFQYCDSAFRKENGIKYLGNKNNPYLYLVEAQYSADVVNVTIDEHCRFIGYNAFYHCKNLTSIDVHENNPNYKSIDGNLYSKDGSAFIKYCTKKTDTSFIIPDTVTKICIAAFADCNGLISVTIPDSVTYIDINAFSGAVNLKNIEIPNSVTHIDHMAFASCFSLENIVLPDSVCYLGTSVFSACKNLKSIVFSNSLTKIEEQTCNNCTNLISVTIPASVTKIGMMAFYNCNNLADMRFEGTVTQWNDMYRHSAWIQPSSLTMICSDGEVEI